MATFYEFFAGGGMARAGLGPQWQCLFANDFDPKKTASYAANWHSGHLAVGDVAKISTADLPGQADLAWASFPCQDLSLAGAGAGLDGDRSGTFWPFWRLVKRLGSEGRAPRIVVLENVCGALSSHGGKDFAAIAAALTGAGYRYGAVVIDAVHFVPQSRPRLFIVGIHNPVAVPARLAAKGPEGRWYPPALIEAQQCLSTRSQRAWVWWRLPEPQSRFIDLSDVIEGEPQGVAWNTVTETKRLLEMMSDTNLDKLKAARKTGRRVVGTIYKRTRGGVQRAEVRFDDVAGCLRTPSGGSSRQTILVVDGRKVRSRLLSPRECARLMGLPDSYILPNNYNDAYRLAGDGLVVPVVRFLASNLIEELLSREQDRIAA